MRQKNGQSKTDGRIRKAFRDLVVPTSLGIGLAVAACSGTPAEPADAAADKKTDAQVDYPIFAIMPLTDSGAKDTGKTDAQIDYPILAIMPPVDSGAKDAVKTDVQGSETIYAIMMPKA